MSKDDYTQLETTEHLEPCPVCCGNPLLWRYSENSSSQVLVAIGPCTGIVNEGCLLYMPPDIFYRPTIREAIAFWNAYAIALVKLRTEQQLQRHFKGTAHGDDD